MLLNDPIFLFLFLPAALLIYWNVRPGYRPYVILASSLLFVSCNGFHHLGFFLLTTAVNWFLLSRITGRSENVKKHLTVTVAWNVAFLCLFKYYGFINKNVGFVLPNTLPEMNLILPVGISYYTFVMISCAVDASRRLPVKKLSLTEYLNYVSFFPKFICGPITKSVDFGNQITEPVFRNKTGNISSGIAFIIIGLAKKALVADVIARKVNTSLWLSCGTLNFCDAWIAAFAYTLQIYFDFSGYSDMAVGIGRLFGLELPINFNAPYQSKNFREFWKRWHISLSEWLMQYIYIPLGGSRKSAASAYCNILITMLICGIWHGASFTFLMWGAIHGTLLVVFRMFRSCWDAIPPFLARAAMLPLITMTWVYFRAPSIAEGNAMIEAMTGISRFSLAPAAKYEAGFVITLAVGFFYTQFMKDTSEINLELNFQWVVMLTLLGIFSILMTGQKTEFLYLRF